MSYVEGLVQHYSQVRTRLWTAPTTIQRKSPLPRRFGALNAYAEYVPPRHAQDCVRLHDEPQMRTPIPDVEIPWVRIPSILALVCAHYHVRPIDVVSKRRTANVVLPRQVAMYIARETTTLSFPQIGRQFGNRDHSTVMHAWRKIGRVMATDPVLSAEVESIQRAILERARG